MSLDELLYSKFLNYLKTKRKKKLIEQQNITKLQDIKPKLTILARAITGKPIYIFPAEKEGGYKNFNFFLPAFFPYKIVPNFPENLSQNFYIFRTLYLCFQQKLNINLKHEVDEETARKLSYENSEKVLKKLFSEFPKMKITYETLLQNFEKFELHHYYLYGKLMKNSKNLPQNFANYNNKLDEKLNKKIKTTLKAKPVEELQSLQIDKKQQEDYVLNHYFEKVETAEEFSGIWRDFDGSDELNKHSNALDELKMKFTVRTDEQTHSIYQAEFIENTSIPESKNSENENNFILYDEWDYKKRKYKINFCKVFPTKIQKQNVNYYKETIKKYSTLLTSMRKMLASLNNKYKQFRKQVDGDDFDLDATTDMLVELLSKKSPTEKIYLSKRKKEKSISILMLLDLSLSSDGYAKNNRIIDVEKQISILFGEILAEFNVDFSICGFYSKTRNNVKFLTIKEFNDDWNKAKLKIGSLEPAGYTRIGPAIRHAGNLLLNRHSKNKWLILISDGKPNDYDKYEGKYGINDIKQALRELNSNKIHSYAFAIEAQAKYYLPQMFGQNHFQILTNPTELLKALIKLYDKIKHS